MPKVKISEYSATANSNTDVASINIDEGCAPSGINNAIRAVMGHLKDFQQGTNGDPFNGPVNGTLGATTPSTASVTTLTTSSTVTHNGGTANGVAYLNGSKVLTTGSALVFDGSNLGLGVTPSTNAGQKTFSIANQTGGFAALTMGSNFTQAGYIGYNMGNTGTNSTWKYISSDNGSALWFNGNEFRFMQFASGTAGNTTNGTQAMTLDASGNLLVGGTSNAVGARAILENAAGNQIGLRYSSVATYYQSVDASGNYIITKDGTERARIDSSGNTGIGTTSTTAVRLIVKGSTSNGTSNAFKLIDSADADILAMSTAGDFYLPKMGSSTGTTVVLTSGNYLVKSSSSIRYKKDVEPIDIGLNFVLGLSPVKYKMKLDDANQVGFIAEDFPDERLVSFSLVNPQDKQSELQRESVNYANLVAPLVKAIQEQQAIIQSLTDRITALESA